MVVAFFPLTLSQNHLNYEGSCLEAFRPIICRNEVNFSDIQQKSAKLRVDQTKNPNFFFLKSLKVKTCQSSDKDNSLNSNCTYDRIKETNRKHR